MSRHDTKEKLYYLPCCPNKTEMAAHIYTYNADNKILKVVLTCTYMLYDILPTLYLHGNVTHS